MRPSLLAGTVLLSAAAVARADDAPTLADAKNLVETFCYDCHGYGGEEGGIALDGLVERWEAAEGDPNAEAALRDEWGRVLKLVRADVMPPADYDRPSDEEVARLGEWIKRRPFGVDPQNPDPGRVTLHRLNRTEYRNTIRDLMGIDYKADAVFPADDSGHGFDNMADVLSLSPLQFEKYALAAQEIIERAVPLSKDAERYREWFPQDVPDDIQGRTAYARELLQSFAERAYRRPARPETIDRLVELAAASDGETFEEGVSRAMAAVLASPRFLYREEENLAGDESPYPLIDEYSLASRLSYFLWSTAPDQELIRLASEGRLREHLDEQFDRLLGDRRSEEFIRNFVGQWLRSRDVISSPVNARAVLRKDDAGRKWVDFNLDDQLRRSMRRETEMLFGYLLREGRSALELLDSDYTFLNERLAQHYGIKGVEGNEMRRVDLPEGSPRGGVLTQGTVLVTTSNPDRTSPVKRGVFVLDNLIGTPPPPPPQNVPALEDAKEDGGSAPVSLRRSLEIHRDSPLCSSCHARMDPLGFALENFDALGLYRESESGEPIDPSGVLASGESFSGIEELKRVLVNERRTDFYRCLTEKVLMYALGRGVEHGDTPTVDGLVEQLETSGGDLRGLFRGVVHSAPFQRRRREEPPPTATAALPQATNVQ